MNKKNIIYTLSIIFSCLLIAFLTYCLEILSNTEKAVLVGLVSIIFITAIISIFLQKTRLLRLMVTLIIFSLFFALLFLILDKSGFWENISTIDSLKAFIKARGVFSSLIFLIIQILQVVAIPLPGAVTTSVGNIMFGAFLGSALSYVGIIIGSVMAFVIGRKFGYKLVVWIAGEESVNKVLNMIKGKDKIMFTMIFLLPFFPDDLLCFVAGLTPMSLLFFTVMAMLTRIVTVGATALFTELLKTLIYTRTLASYVILALIAIVLVLIFLVTVKHGEKIQSFFENLYIKAKNSLKNIFSKKDNKEK